MASPSPGSRGSCMSPSRRRASTATWGTYPCSRGPSRIRGSRPSRGSGRRSTHGPSPTPSSGAGSATPRPGSTCVCARRSTTRAATPPCNATCAGRGSRRPLSAAGATPRGTCRSGGCPVSARWTSARRASRCVAPPFAASTSPSASPIRASASRRSSGAKPRSACARACATCSSPSAAPPCARSSTMPRRSAAASAPRPASAGCSSPSPPTAVSTTASPTPAPETRRATARTWWAPIAAPCSSPYRASTTS